ncbi:pyruvate:ferredoxin (flavodoxin) oxidoreductase [Synechococcus sp. RSCCF101]|uniref:pyruvate:ferredoxin (flavodoxin) oxidoreductase n=1 Tax=Synechococcus sp. RSCCF101 TaxID=2511069 RepID=UPI001246C5CF|nr:pyruvate:ferredoxin (flavodoxin) oxidoreductase [Synechococcus sp. RSCCF101]QEY33061.1 pyruvate:ferredoxin (flavodoxin) oxidoreductase [Synechococcus sp. RSCCF101]
MTSTVPRPSADTTALQPITVDGNEAVARVAYRLSEVIAIYPITPASPMGEWADSWASAGRPNLWGQSPGVVELQSEAGAAGTIHGALQAGALTTSFTASQGLLLMVPNLYKIAGELTPSVLHVAARSLAAQGLSIFGDHSDVMATRGTGWGVLVSASVQEAADLAAIATSVSVRSRLPFLHVFDGFRTSHEIQKVQPIDDATLRELIPEDALRELHERRLTPDRPVIRGTSQNPDVYFQARESVNPFYRRAPELVAGAMARFASLTGRRYAPYEYVGSPEAERVLVLMGSGCETAHETVDALTAAGEAVGVLKVRLFRPFDGSALVDALPASVRQLAVLDRCKDPGAPAEPLCLDLLAALSEHWSSGHPGRPMPRVIGGRYGLSSKEFTPAMVKAVFDHLAAGGRGGFTVGIEDDVSGTSIAVDDGFRIEPDDEVRAVFYGLGSDGTVGANKSSIKIIGESTPLHAQGYFVYDSKKSGSVTVSHLRFGPRPIRSAYLIQNPTLVACHQWEFLERFDVLDGLGRGGTLLLNSPYGIEESWRRMPADLRVRILELGLTVWVIDASRVAREAGMGRHINTVMQAGFFAVSGVLPREEAIERIRASIRKVYGRKGEAVVTRNLQALEAALDHLLPLDPLACERDRLERDAAGADADPEDADPPLSERLAAAPPFVRDVIGPMLQRRGDNLPVSALPCDGTWPVGTSRWEKRNIAEEVPVWDEDLCVQCGKCLMVCPHAVIRAKTVEPAALQDAPAGFRHAPARPPAPREQRFTIQVAVEDCTGCHLCVEVCPVRDRQEPRRKALNMEEQRPLRASGRASWDFFLGLPERDRRSLDLHRIGQQQQQQPLFEFSGACAGCGETPYIKLATQLFGDRMLVANATGCSSIYGGNLPTTPWAANAAGQGPAWSNSLFEDNAEFGFGMRVALDQRRSTALNLLEALGEALPLQLREALVRADQSSEAGLAEQRQRVEELRDRLRALIAAAGPEQRESRRQAERLLDCCDGLLRRSVWLIGGDGWAYDIGYGGLDHVLASGRDVNVLVLDTEVYSNTGGQMSKATPLGAVAKFAAGGKAMPKKDLGLMAMTYGHVYVASVAMGARDEHTLRAFLEAESYPGPSLILAYSHCIAHGIDMTQGLAHQKSAVDSGRWLLYRYDPRRLERGESPLQIDSRSNPRGLAASMEGENRFRMLRFSQPERARALVQQAERNHARRMALYRALADSAQPGDSRPAADTRPAREEQP